MKNYRIFQCEDRSLCNQVKPDFIYNRFDRWEVKTDQVNLWCCEEEGKKIYFEILISGRTAKLGIWLMPINEDLLKHILREIFRAYKEISVISFENGYSPAFGKNIQKNHFRIELPGSVEELDKRLSKKGRYNIRREKRLLRDANDGYEIEDIPALASEALVVWEKYFEYKKVTHNTDYHMTILEYCSKYHVTDVYVLYVGEKKHIASIILSCEQCEIAYIENLTYDIELSEFSPGQILYDEYLKKLINKGFREIYLLGGEYSYKKRYGSIEEIVYNSEIPRNVIIRTCEWGVGSARKLYHKLKQVLLK